MVVEDFKSSYLTYMQTSHFENICIQVFCQSMSPQLRSVVVSHEGKKEGGEAGTVPEDGNARSCCYLGLAVGGPLGLAWYLCMPPSLSLWQQSWEDKQEGEAHT